MASAPLAEDLASDAYPGVAEAACMLGMGTADHVRLEAVALRLRAEGVAGDDPRVPLWFAAALCRSAEQRRAFLSEFIPSPPLPALPPPAAESTTVAQDKQAAGEFEAQRRRLVLLAVGLIAGALLAVFLLLRAFGGPADSPTVSLSNMLGPVMRTVQLSVPKQAETVVADWGSIIALATIVAAAMGYWLWRKRRLRRLKAAFSPEPDKAVPLAMGNEATRLFASQAIRAGLRRLRRHRSQPGSRLDVRTSIAATIRAGGQPQALFRGRWLMPEYLLLAEREGPRDHLAAAGEALAARIRQENVAIGHYEFFGRPDRLRVAGGDSASIPLASVLAREADARSMLLAEGFDLRDGPLTPAWAERIADAGPAVHLNPRLSGARTEAETLLAEDGVDSFPLSVRGITAMAQRLADPRAPHGLLSNGPPQFDLPHDLDAERKRMLAEEAPRPMVVRGVIEDLTAWLDAESYRWFAALSVFPYLEPALTLYVGSHLKDAWGEAILTDERYLALARLPWMRAGSMPYWLRLELAHSLDADTLASAAAAIQAFLLPVVEGGEAREITIEHGRDPAKRRLLLTWLMHSPESEFHDPILIDMFKGRRPDQLGVRPAEALARRFDRVRQDPTVRFYAVVAVALALTVFARPPAPTVMRDTGENELVDSQVIDYQPTPVPTSSPTETETPAPTPSASPSPMPTKGPPPQPTTRPTPDVAPSPIIPDNLSGGTYVVYFDWDRSSLSPSAPDALDVVVATWQKFAAPVLINIAGHTDRERAASYSVGLSQRMADSVRDYLMSRGIPAEYIQTEAYGSSRPRVPTGPGVREPMNRRAEITFWPDNQRGRPPDPQRVPAALIGIRSSARTDCRKPCRPAR